jgi:hypothetical protein
MQISDSSLQPINIVSVALGNGNTTSVMLGMFISVAPVNNLVLNSLAVNSHINKGTADLPYVGQYWRATMAFCAAIDVSRFTFCK